VNVTRTEVEVILDIPHQSILPEIRVISPSNSVLLMLNCDPSK